MSSLPGPINSNFVNVCNYNLVMYIYMLVDEIINETRSYTADAVWYRQPSGQPTNTVMLNLN